jgi:hypothetical protein
MHVTAPQSRHMHNMAKP